MPMLGRSSKRHCGWGLALALATVILMVARPAAAETGPYIGAQIGLSTLSNSPGEGFDSGYVGGGSFGYALPGHLRPELAVNYAHNGVKGASDASANLITVMANVWYDFEYSHTYMYFGAGAGYIHAHASGSASRFSVGGGSANESTGGGQVGFGAGFFLTPAVSMGIDYRYVIPFNQGKIEARAQSLMVALRISFGSHWNPLDNNAHARPVRVVPVQGGDGAGH